VRRLIQADIDEENPQKVLQKNQMDYKQ